ncbi:UNVERIFIED_CONTAM: hypothetical protein RMT77_001397 [Armadillidium vulgare]
MNENSSYGFCDLNLSVEEVDLKKTILKGLKLGYETFAINMIVSDEIKDLKINKKGDNREILIPLPHSVKFLDSELSENKIYKKPKILTRLTIKCSNNSSYFLHKAKEAVNNFDIVAFSPVTEDAFKQLCLSNMEMDIISFDFNEIKFRPSKKLLRLAVKNNVYFEIPYAPCIRSPSTRRSIIQLAHSLFRISKSMNILISSAAENANELRNPYDVANFAILLGLSPSAAKLALSFIVSDALHCAKMRRCGASKCASEISRIESCSKKGKFSSLYELEELIN